MCKQTSLFFSFVYDSLVLSHSDVLMKQMECLSLFRPKTLFVLYKRNFDLYHLIANIHNFVSYWSLNSF